MCDLRLLKVHKVNIKDSPETMDRFKNRISTLQTTYKIYYQNSNAMQSVASNSVDLVVTSPPYPMIAMWDEMFIKQDPAIQKALDNGMGYDAFKRMHKTLDEIWNECYRILKNGAFACINIGDATRTVNGNFMLYPNHSRILQHLLEIGFTSLPAILWRKQTNAPNKFMGSGMLPAGAYNPGTRIYSHRPQRGKTGIHHRTGKA